MVKIITNIAIIIGLIAVVFGGYFLYTEKGVEVFGLAKGTQVPPDVIAKTTAFIGYAREIKSIDIKSNLDVLEDYRFTSLRSFRTDIEKTKVGRTNPFIPADESENEDDDDEDKVDEVSDI